MLNEDSLNDVRVLDEGNLRYYAKKSSLVHPKEILEKELRIMLRFRDHPRIVQAASPLLHLGNEPEDCYINMKFASTGTLRDRILEFNRKPMPENMIRCAVRMILQGLDALHSNGYVHGNLNPSNILVFPSTTVGEPWDLKLAGFGASKEPNYPNDAPLCGFAAKYMSPESFEPNGPIDQALDIYSLGCIVYEMFGGMAEQEIFEEYYEWILFKVISPVAQDFLRMCHGIHPYRRNTVTDLLKMPIRATASELLNHPFVTQIINVPLPTTTQDPDSPVIPRLPSSIC